MDAHESVIETPVVAGSEARRWKLWLSLVVAGAAVLVIAVRLFSGGTKAAPPMRPVPVSTAAARLGDMPVNLIGLGTVIPTEAVTVRTRVDGQIMKVNFKEGQFVKAGDLLIQIDPRPFQVQLLQAEGQMAKDQAALKNAQLDLERYRSLFNQKIIPQQQLDTQQATVDQAAAAVKADLGAVESAKLNLVYAHITAPLSGKVGLRLVDPGNVVHANDTNGLVTMTPVSPINVLFTLPADNIQAIMDSSRAGHVPVVDVFDRDMKNKLATGTLLAVDNQVDTTTGTVRIKAQFDNKDGALFPNQFVNARLRVDTLKDALMIPAAAVQQSPQGTFVYVVKPDATVDFRKVDVRITDGETSAVRSGLKDGERVVINGLDKLRPGSRIAEDGMNAPGQGGQAPAQAPAPAPVPGKASK